jgi:hypothetical protein
MYPSGHASQVALGREAKRGIESIHLCRKIQPVFVEKRIPLRTAGYNIHCVQFDAKLLTLKAKLCLDFREWRAIFW